jgi:hypothetical protein
METLPKSEIVLYQTEDGRARVECRFENETIWLSLNQMAELFQTTKQNVSLHIQNIFEEGELQRGVTAVVILCDADDGVKKKLEPVMPETNFELLGRFMELWIQSCHRSCHNTEDLNIFNS